MKLFKVIETSFENFDNSIRLFLSKTFNNLGLEYSHSQIFGVIFDGIKGIVQNIMFYIEDALTEQNIFKASRKKSVYSLAKLSGYEAYYGSAATGTVIGKLLQNNMPSVKATKIFIPNNIKLVNKVTGVVYSMQLPTNTYVFDTTKPLVSHSFKIVQGIFKNAVYIGKGLNLETIHVSCSALFDKNYISVKVDGEEWHQASSLYDMLPNGKEYVISIGFDNEIDIMFGNEINGKKLLEGQNVSITYLSHQGISGNIFPNDISKFLFDGYGFDSNGKYININDYMSLSLVTCVSGGSNSDTIDFVRKMIGANSRSLVLATEDNFKLFFKRFSFVGYVNCWSEENSMIITATCMKNVKNEIKEPEDYFKIKKDQLLLSKEQKYMIINTLNNSKKSFAGVTLNFNDPIIRRFAFILYVKANNIYNQDTIKAHIKRVLAKYFMTKLENTQFIPKSDIIKVIIDNVENIKSLDIDIISELAEQAYKNNYYYKYELKYINGTYQYVSKKIIYESTTVPGLDFYGNIQLDSKLEVPYLQGGFKYYINKDSMHHNDDNVVTDTIQVIFI